MSYSEWIQNNVAETFGQCAEATAKMQDAFPELTRVRGHYFCPIWEDRAHWWLVDPAGKIVDPTAGQFPSKGNGTYTMWDESEPEPTGKCLECGEYAFGSNFCSDEHQAAFMEEFL